jgi:cysteine desulfurase
MLHFPIYMDHLSTTPVDPRVLDAMLPYFQTHYGNASSRSHQQGRHAHEAVMLAREQVADLIGCVREELIFTSGATESINLALRGVSEAYASKGNHIITCVTEHRAVLDTCSDLEKKGMQITYLPVNENGQIDPEQLKASITASTILFCFMYANNETGIIHPIREIATIAKERGVLFLCDATQAVGKIPVQVTEDGMDLMAFSAHKIYGPKGCGALYIRRKNPRVQIKAQITGGGQERNLRSGTLNVPGIVGLGQAAALCQSEMEEEAKRLLYLRTHFETELAKLKPIWIAGTSVPRLPHVSNCCFQWTEGPQLLLELAPTLALSSGSACSSESSEPSFVLTAMNRSKSDAKRSIRFCFGRFNTKDEIDYALDLIIRYYRQHNTLS